VGRRQQRADRGRDAFGHRRRVGGVELAVEVQEREPVDEPPEAGAAATRVEIG
jgi:hypothetical protein